MKSFVINLESRPDRKAAFDCWNRRQPVAYSYFPAISGRSVNRFDLVAKGHLAPEEALFNAGSLGNALSHRALWEECARGDEPYLIFEDDCCLRGDFWRHAQPIISREANHRHMIVFGFNTDAAIAIRGADGVLSAIRFDETIKRHPDYFCQYSQLKDGRPNLFRCHQFWGILAYAISPKGAQRLIEECFPLASDEPVELIGEDRKVPPYGLDGRINLALQKERLDALICYPPLALGPNSQTMSDIQAAIRA